MSKVSIKTIENLQNESSAIGALNSNFVAIQTVIDTLLSRNGSSPNQMISLLDMNSQRIINLPAPVNNNEPARHGDLQQYVDEASGFADDAAASAADAGVKQVDVTAKWHDILKRYIGAYASDPTVDDTGVAVVPGAMYYNTTVDEWRFFVEDHIVVGTSGVVVGSSRVIVRYWQAYPQVTLRSLNDVSTDVIADGDFLVWDAGSLSFIPLALAATGIPYTNASLDATTVGGALDEIVTETTLGRYDLAFYIEGLLSEAECLFRMVALHSFTIQTTAVYSAYVGTAPAAAQTLYLKKNGVQFGTISFALGSNTGTISIPGDTVFNKDDRLEMFNQAIPDTAARDFSLSISAKRTV